MPFRTLMYRLFRLRRLYLAAMILPALAVVLVSLFKGPIAFVFLIFAILLPLLHVIRYPNACTETLAVSATLTLLIGVAGTIGPDVGLLGLALRILGLAVLGFIGFFASSTLIPFALDLGPAKPVFAKARRSSALAAAELRKAITLYPGRIDDRVECGAADEKGVFPITLKHQAPSLEFLDDPESEVVEEDFHIELFGVVLSSTDDSHEVVCMQDESEDTTTTKYTFVSRKNGTTVEIAEYGAPMSPGYAFCFWLQDYIADYLTDEVDRAEGHASRANRFHSQDQLLFDLARLFVGKPGGTEPAE